MDKNSWFGNKSGLTFIELMIVIAIIGILTAISVPNYQKHIAKSRQAEAKTALSAIFTFEQAFHLEKGSFSQCLVQLGFTPNTNTQYYTIGWNNHYTSCGPGPAINQDCWAYTWNDSGNGVDFCFVLDTCFIAKDFIGTGPAQIPAISQLSGNGSNASTNAFLLKAVGNISSTGGTQTGYDIWTINEQKTLTNIQQGF